MAREYDSQLLESVAVRRRRLRDSLLWGGLRHQRSTADNVARFVVGCVVAAVVCAGCVGWAFLQDVLPQQKQVSTR
ncbi:hypothetical protein ACQPZF_23185 [Actinosynnema sp. CS-041913]|uniref:hypothetical protein n=1 Tax=Actinosynnema sp. CS-041913 TaxID=3239917 RepID=UPI003D8BF65E